MVTLSMANRLLLSIVILAYSIQFASLVRCLLETDDNNGTTTTDRQHDKNTMTLVDLGGIGEKVMVDYTSQYEIGQGRVTAISENDELTATCSRWEHADREKPSSSHRWEPVVCENKLIGALEHCNVHIAEELSSLPMISILAGVSTRGVNWQNPNELAVFRHLLPSVVKTVQCGFRYAVVLGYDNGDAFYDTVNGRDILQKWFQRNVAMQLRKANILIELTMVAVKNDIQKPGPVFNEIARVAYESGADYFYRINDDSEFLNPWAYKFVRAIQGMGQPYGVVGPVCNQSNTKILNHDFTHRTHMEIFAKTYYPPELTDWYMDDWISMTYGSLRTKQLASVEILHHTQAQNVRYSVDFYRREYLHDLVEKGRQTIVTYMEAHGVPKDEVAAFNASQFENFAIEMI